MFSYALPISYLYDPFRSFIIRAAGATVVKSSSLQGNARHTLDAILVDRLTLPPHATAIPKNMIRTLNNITHINSHGEGGRDTPVIDLSWAVQCVIQRKRLQFDNDERFQIQLTGNRKGEKLFTIKVKSGSSMVRYEVGDLVEFGKGKELSRIGRITGMRQTADRTRKFLLDMQLLEHNGDFVLIDGGSASTTVTIEETELLKHLVLLSSKDYRTVKNGYGSRLGIDQYIFQQKTAP